MSSVTMTLLDAINRRKIMQKQLETVKQYRICCVRKKFDEVDATGTPLSDILEKNIKPGYQSSVALIKNFIALSAAINDANAKVMVEVDGNDKPVSIANLITQKNEYVKLRNMYSAILSNYQSILAEVEKKNEKALSKDAIEQYLSRTLGDSSKRSPEDIEVMTANYEKRNTYAVYDPLNSVELAQKELEKIGMFLSAVDRAITIADANTQITVEFVD